MICVCLRRQRGTAVRKKDQRKMQNLECLPQIPKERKTQAGAAGRLLNSCLSEYNTCAVKKLSFITHCYLENFTNL